MTLLLDSRRLPRADRADAVASAVRQREVPQQVTVDTSGPDLWHRLELWDLGPGAHLLHTVGTGMTVSRGPEHLRIPSARRLAASLQLSGSGRLRTEDGTLDVAPGDLYLIDQAGAFDYHWAGITGSLAFVVDYDQLGLPVDAARAAAPRLASSPMYGLTRAHFAGLRRTMDQLGSGGTQPMVGHATLELVRALITTATPGGPGTGEASGHLLRLRVTRYIEQHLSDPALHAGQIAAAHHISVRHLYSMWTSHDLTLAQWIIHQRLERARSQLASHGQAVTVTAVGRRCGFTNVSHFCRRFRAAYGTSPREWRQLNLSSPHPLTSHPLGSGREFA
jgi:AraC family transcriptional activator of tynA and feaB